MPHIRNTPRRQRLTSCVLGNTPTWTNAVTSTLTTPGPGSPPGRSCAAHAARIGAGCFGNPHSENPTSSASTLLVEQAREAVLRALQHHAGRLRRHLHAQRHRRLPPGRRGVPVPASARRLVLTADNHNSVNGHQGVRPGAGRPGRLRPATAGELRVNESDVLAALVPRPGAAIPGCSPIPAQSNFSGVQHPLGWVAPGPGSAGYDVLLDAAAYVPANRLDLSAVRAASSWR